jgi:hypothetical protein
MDRGRLAVEESPKKYKTLHPYPDSSDRREFRDV